MRSKVLRKRGTSFIQSNSEPQKHRRPWGKYAYIAALLFLGTSVAKWGHGKVFYIRGEGFLESERTHVEAPITGRIVDVRCKIDDDVSEGEPLVFISNPTLSYSMSRRGGTGYGVEPAKLIDLQSQISLLRQEIQQNNDALGSLKAEREKARSLLQVNAITRPQLARIEDKLQTSFNNSQLLQIKLDAAERILRLYLGQDEGKTSPTGNASLSTINEGILYASHPGVVAQIYKQEGEVARVGEPVIQIVDRANNFIKAYFSGHYENEIREGDRAKVYFENGEKSRGVVRKIYPTAANQPVELRRKYGKSQRYIIAEIVREDGKPWDRILETEVTVSLKKKWF